MGAAIDYKKACYAELRRREKQGIKGPDPLPHPDDVIIDMRTGSVAIRGPMSEAEKDLWLLADTQKTELRKKIRDRERKLKRGPDHPDRAVLLKDIETLTGLSPYPETPVTTESRSLATALPMGALRERLHRQNLHHAGTRPWSWPCPNEIQQRRYQNPRLEPPRPSRII